MRRRAAASSAESGPSGLGLWLSNASSARPPSYLDRPPGRVGADLQHRFPDALFPIGLLVDAAQAWYRPAMVFAPDAARFAVYQEVYARYKHYNQLLYGVGVH